MAAANVTPMVQQYMAVKQEHQNELLFFRLGDFYEMFFDDALTASRELNLTLTKRSNGMEHMPMCGVPYHSVDGYIAKLIKKGYRIAICEQVEDPKLAKGIVERKVIKIITPGTALNEQLLEDKHNRYLVFLQQAQEKGMCLAAADVTTGECEWFLDQTPESFLNITEQLYRLQPAELVVHLASEEMSEKLQEWLAARLPECVVTHYDESTPEADYFAQHFAGCDVPDEVHSTVELLLRYLHGTVMADLSHINRLVRIERNSFMNLDVTAVRNLELVRNMTDGSKRGTLLQVLDFTNTSMGARRLRSWIESPLLDVGRIYERQEAVAELAAAAELREAIVAQLKAVADLERIVSRIEVGSANARDLVALRNSLSVLPGLKGILEGGSSGLLRKLWKGLHLHEELAARLQQAIVDEPPFSVREGGMIRTGYNQELDELHLIAADNKTWMQNFEQKIKEETGIKTMKVGFNKVFGYYIEVSKGQSSSVPPYFVRKQTLVNAERYIVPELKEFENKILGAKEKIEQLEYYLFDELRTMIRGKIKEIQETARAVSYIDVLTGLAEAAYKYNYVRPELNNNGEIKIVDGRHPVVERLLEKEIFVPNNTNLNNTDERMIIITGPNMAGKSTYMRQVALLVLMTQIGSFIPARQASVCPVDKIFTRVGASDDLATGQSTFMVEMNEVAQILKYATKNSLIILDEVGRGTSTFDGMSIAHAVMEYIHDRIKAKTLFATHYHQLIALENVLSGVKNYSVAVKERGKDIIFLRRIVPGGTDRSYGVHVARLAGLPKKVLERSEELLKEYDNDNGRVQQPAAATAPDNMMGSLFGSSIANELLKLDVMSMTPIEAMSALYKLQDEARKELGK
ncbi:DNA mismatch repair protein MutS [Phascolarctobacterium succinatutens]|uniref:DNA mismatch repair protein MutS n=1 Tax=Phascolarctobacterium succinatutens TaxID=626940 RepID=UPI0026F1F306|nr:DNA mismatch repair protein MutS [Phascolarctobacterium succinatutens]